MNQIILNLTSKRRSRL